MWRFCWRTEDWSHPDHLLPQFSRRAEMSLREVNNHKKHLRKPSPSPWSEPFFMRRTPTPTARSIQMRSSQPTRIVMTLSSRSRMKTFAVTKWRYITSPNYNCYKVDIICQGWKICWWLVVVCFDWRAFSVFVLVRTCHLTRVLIFPGCWRVEGPGWRDHRLWLPATLSNNKDSKQAIIII